MKHFKRGPSYKILGTSGIAYMDKRRCEIQEQKEDPLYHTGICEPG
jgi:hypothetical protein